MTVDVPPELKFSVGFETAFGSTCATFKILGMLAAMLLNSAFVNAAADDLVVKEVPTWFVKSVGLVGAVAVLKKVILTGFRLSLKISNAGLGTRFTLG